MYLIEKRKTTWLSGLAFGIALGINVVPLIFSSRRLSFTYRLFVQGLSLFSRRQGFLR